LGPAHRKGWDDDLALAFDGFAHELPDLRGGVGLWRVLATTVGAFDLQVIHIFDRLRVAKDVVLTPSDVAAEE